MWRVDFLKWWLVFAAIIGVLILYGKAHPVSYKHEPIQGMGQPSSQP